MPRIFHETIPDKQGDQVSLWGNQASVPRDSLLLVTLWDNPALPGMPSLQQCSFQLTLAACKAMHEALGKHLEAHGCTSSED